MLLTEYLKKHPVKAWRLKVAAGGWCENCSNEFPQFILEIHVIGSPPDTESVCSDLQKHLLLLCPACQRSFLSVQVEESLQRELVRLRSRKVRKMMREILGYRPRQYVPPGDFDPEVIFLEMVSSGATDYCLNGG
jgi:hypothetical protein